MQFVFVRRARGQIEFGIIYGVIALLALLAGRFLPVFTFAPGCAFKALTGYPCPTCGSTRSVVFLAHGDFSSALLMNPLIFLAFLTAILALLYGALTLLFDLPRITPVLAEHEKDLVRFAAVFIVLLNWVYLFFTL